jgi:hypothetical protein
MRNTLMGTLTAFVLAAFVGYGSSWYMGLLEGNFALLLLLATTVTGLYWLAERFYFLPSRQRAAQALESGHLQRQAEWAKSGIRADVVYVARPRSSCSCSLGGWTGRRGCFRSSWWFLY